MTELSELYYWGCKLFFFYYCNYFSLTLTYYIFTHRNQERDGLVAVASIQNEIELFFFHLPQRMVLIKHITLRSPPGLLFL